MSMNPPWNRRSQERIAVAVSDEDGRIVEEVRICDANLNDITERYAGLKAAIEATSNYTIYNA